MSVLTEKRGVGRGGGGGGGEEGVKRGVEACVTVCEWYKLRHFKITRRHIRGGGRGFEPRPDQKPGS